MTVADRVKARREELQLTQEELAKKMGYAMRTTVSTIELSGDNVSLKKIEKLAKALRVSESYLLGYEENDEDENSPSYTEKDLELLDNVKVLPKDKKDYIVRLVNIFNSELDVDTDVLGVYLSSEEQRLAKKKQMISFLKEQAN